MKHYYVSIVMDKGGEHFPVKHGYEFSGATAACAAYGLACRAAGMEPGTQTRLRQWCRAALRGNSHKLSDSLRMVTVCMMRTA